MKEQLKFDNCGVTVAELTAKAIKTLRAFEPEDRPYWGCFSGGKDSIVIKEIARLAGVRVDWYYNQTTIDPPELIYYMRAHHPDIKWMRARTNFFTKMIEKGFPTRRVRWCCHEYKESRSPRGATLILGVRAAESPRRRAAWKRVTANNDNPDYDMDTGVLYLHSPRCRYCGGQYRKGHPCACEIGSTSDAWEILAS